MKRYALFAAILLAACGTEDDSDSGDDMNPTGASSAGSTDPTGSGETGDSSDPATSDDDPTSNDEGGESSGGVAETSDGGETSGTPDSGGSGTCESFNDMTPYYGDVQVDSFCWTAGLYYACGETGAGDETCGILASLANDGGAACPYC